MAFKTLLLMTGLCLALSLGGLPAGAADTTPQQQSSGAALLLAANDLRMQPMPGRRAPKSAKSSAASRQKMYFKTPSISGTWKSDLGADWVIEQKGRYFKFKTKNFAYRGHLAKKFNACIGEGEVLCSNNNVACATQVKIYHDVPGRPLALVLAGGVLKVDSKGVGHSIPLFAFPIFEKTVLVLSRNERLRQRPGKPASKR